jgi:hypothetical protein
MSRLRQCLHVKDECDYMRLTTGVVCLVAFGYFVVCIL